jgi:hypothetical protein
MALSNDRTAPSAKVDAMQPVGNINQAHPVANGSAIVAGSSTIPCQDPDHKYT